MRVKVWESQASGSTPFILAVCKRVATVAHVRPPPSLPANRLFFRLCKSLHNRKNSLFVGSERGGKSFAVLASLVNTAKLNGVDPEVWLAVVLERIISGKVKANEMESLLPWNWKAEREAMTQQERRAA